MRTLLRILAILLPLAFLACEGEAPPAPAEPGQKRIVVLSPALGVIARDLGLEDRIVGRHAFDMVLDKALPVCGDQSGLDYERLLAAKPTDILLEPGASRIPPRLEQLASKHRWNIHTYATLTIENVITTVDSMEAEFGRIRAGANPVGLTPPFSHSLTEALKPKPGHDLSNAGRVLLLESLNPPAALGPGSAHHEVLVRLGGTPAITAGRPFITLDAEAILSLKPDVVILIAPRPYGSPPATYSTADIQSLLGNVGTLDTPAVRHQRLAVIDHPLALLPSTALIDFAREMDRILQPWSK